MSMTHNVIVDTAENARSLAETIVVYRNLHWSTTLHANVILNCTLWSI